MELQLLYKDIQSKLKNQTIEFADQEARYIILHVIKQPDDIFIRQPDYKISREHLESIEQIVDERLAGKPLSKIIGEKEFWGLAFKTSEATLDPRPDTEVLVQAVLDCVAHDQEIILLDLGTGTGCILISLLKELPLAKGVAIDISQKALEIASKNADVHGVSDRFEAIQGDWLEGIDLSNVDYIVSNPPYIRDDVIPDLSPEVKNHDPILSLSGGKNGLDAYEKIFSGLKKQKNFSGNIFLEIGFDQHEELVRLVDESNLCLCDSIRDYGGHIRVVNISCGDK
ncbi:MAG: peptide chain release factor N(5)-glutamine methyltransferase [Pseudomonadota bacterium]